MPNHSLLEVENVSVRFALEYDWLGKPLRFLEAVREVSLSLQAGDSLGIVGESGSGKSTLAQAIMGLVPIESGSIRFKGETLSHPNTLGSSAKGGCQIVFQDPQSSLDPRMRVWEIISEGLEIRRLGTRRERREKAAMLADQVGLDPHHIDRHAHEFSGGQRQRIAIARALALEPELLLLDEPTSALDISVQAQVLNLLLGLQESLGLAYLFISHNISVVDHMCERLIVMKHGQVVEAGETQRVLLNPQAPYTKQLLSSVLRADPVS